ncbi:MAG: flagellar protein export ATPase FliI [Oscillospiraceae bacterium]|jgi:flagellum-specific ATP synthase|nr:flagellar protein export ATPase FliI [Oscillospiraceae bacterium]
MNLLKYREAVNSVQTLELCGRVTEVVGLSVEVSGPPAKVGDLCEIISNLGTVIRAEVVGFRGEKILLMPYGSLEGVGFGSVVRFTGGSLKVGVGMNLLGRVINALGEPFDDLPPIIPEVFYPVEASPPHPMARNRIHDVLPLGVRSIDSLLTVGVGQRLGIFAGSGVGKSTLLGMMARYAESDVSVIALVGERGREVRDFIEDSLGEEGLKRSVVVIATSDQPALLRLKAALVGTAIAEYFRDRGLKVLLMMDSLTRFSHAQREIGMATGEPPVSRGYPPSVYTIMPKLLERSGNSDKGSITGLYTVLVDGDDMDEPIADTARGILDGHIVLSRKLANSNHYPPIDILASVSRVMPEIVTKEHYGLAGTVKNMMAVYNEAEDLINIGAYKSGANPEIDNSIKLHPVIQTFLRQASSESATFEDTQEKLRAMLAPRRGTAPRNE